MALAGMNLNSMMTFAAPLLGGGATALKNQAGGQPGMAQAMQMLQMIMQVAMMMQSQMGMVGGGAPNFGGAAAMTPGVGSFLGGGGGGAAVMPASFGGGAGSSGPISSGASPSTSATGSATGGGGDSAKAVEIARQYMGQKTGGINNLAGFTRTGQNDNNCAEFVSACLDKAGSYKKQPGDASVATLAKNLQKQGWKKVGKEQSKPGDVAIFNGSQHVELVSQAGGKELIGSNNKGSVQYVGTDKGNWGNIEYYSKG